MPDHYPLYPSAAQMNHYLNSFADHFKLRDSIVLNTSIKRVSPIADSNGWRIEFSNGSESERFDTVIVATGHHWDKRFAGPYTGEADFKASGGEVIHSKDYKRSSQLAGKSVLVIGGGNSACDVAVEASRFGSSSDLSIRNGVWFLPRMLCGSPLELLVGSWMPVWAQRLCLRFGLWLCVGSYAKYGLPEPTHRLFDRHPTINSDLLTAIQRGAITVRPGIKRFVPNECEEPKQTLSGGQTEQKHQMSIAVEFTNGERRTYDLIVHCTGFHVSVPVIADSIIEWHTNPTDGYAYPNLLSGLIHPTRRGLYVFGLGQPRYGAGPLITAGAEVIAECIKIQPSLKQPIGVVLKALGTQPLRSYLLDPIRVFRESLNAISIASHLPLIERVLCR